MAYSSLSGLPRMSSRSEASWTSGRKASMGIWFAKRYTESSRLTSAGNPSRDGAASSAFTSHTPASTCALDTSPSVISLRTFTGSTGFSRKSRTTGQRAASTASPVLLPSRGCRARARGRALVSGWPPARPSATARGGARCAVQGVQDCAGRGSTVCATNNFTPHNEQHAGSWHADMD